MTVLIRSIVFVVITYLGVKFAYIPFFDHMLQSVPTTDRDVVFTKGLYILGGLFVGPIVFLYYIPSIIAFIRKHPQRWSLLAANAFVGPSRFWGGVLSWALWPQKGQNHVADS